MGITQSNPDRSNHGISANGTQRRRLRLNDHSRVIDDLKMDSMNGDNLQSAMSSASIGDRCGDKCARSAMDPTVSFACILTTRLLLVLPSDRRPIS